MRGPGDEGAYWCARRIPATHPCLAGHFPGRPIVPGVVILEAVLEALAQWLREHRLPVISSVKFTAPLLPEQTFVIHLTRENPDRAAFRCLRGERVLARGVLQLAATLRS